jgi:hypothetical protein
MAKAGEADRRARELAEWTGDVEELARQVRTWCDERGWAVSASEKQIEESAYGTYGVPELMIRSPSGMVYLEPVARDVAGARGRVDLLAWPSLTRMMLVRKANRWVLQTDSGVDWPEQWGRQTFEKIVGLINAAA